MKCVFYIVYILANMPITIFIFSSELNDILSYEFHPLFFLFCNYTHTHTHKHTWEEFSLSFFHFCFSSNKQTKVRNDSVYYCLTNNVFWYDQPTVLHKYIKCITIKIINIVSFFRRTFVVRTVESTCTNKPSR
jgi:hypothetical protein